MRQIESMLGGEDFHNMLVAHFMQTDVYYCPKNAKGDKLATAMTMGKFGSIPIVGQAKKLVGIVSEFDLLKAIIGGEELKEITAASIMTKNPISVLDYTSSGEVIELLQREHLIRVPVVDKDLKLIGIVARKDILYGYLKSREDAPPWWS